MAYMSQSRKAALAPEIKKICKEYGVKASIAVNNHSTLVLNIKSGRLDFIGNGNAVNETKPDGRRGVPAKDYLQINPYWFQEHFTGEVKEFLTKVYSAMMVGNHNNSDIMTDYFDVGWYVDINVGQWDKPYILEK